MHNINSKKGKASIAYSGETPWHRLGQKIDHAFDAATALKEGGLDFTVEKVSLQTSDGQTVPNRFGLRRTDTKDILGVVTDFYKPLQNREAFSFFDGVFGKDKARYEVAGVLGKGEKVWMLAQLPGEFRVGKDDLVKKWLLLTNGHDLSEPVRARFTPIRVVCQNTLSAALASKSNEIRVQHIGNVPGKLEIAGKLLKEAGVYFDEVSELFGGFLKVQLKGKTFTDYVTRAVVGENIIPAEMSNIARRNVAEVERLHQTGKGAEIKGVRGSLWGAYNAVTEFVDHERTKTDIGFLLGGRGGEIKQRAFAVAREMVMAAN